MNTLMEQTDLLQKTDELSDIFGERADRHDKIGMFVKDNYRDLKENGYFALTIPKELGGQGITHSEMCEIIKRIGKSCGSTALAFSMHNHLLATNIWKYKKGQGGDAMLMKVAQSQPILISTGAKDWLESNGTAIKVEEGYLISGLKHFASQSEIGDIAVTSVQYDDPELGQRVLHFPVSMDAQGVSHLSNWDTMGMRGTGSHTIKFDNVFVPEEAVALSRPLGEFHPVWNVVLTVAMPYIMSAYMGIAERAAELVIERFKKSNPVPSHLTSELGELKNLMTTAQVAWRDMIRITNDLNFDATDENGNEILIRKTIVANYVIKTVNKAFDLYGGQGYFRNQEMERLFRDVQGARFHPLSEKEQIRFTGEHLLK